MVSVSSDTAASPVQPAPRSKSDRNDPGPSGGGFSALVDSNAPAATDDRAPAPRRDPPASNAPTRNDPAPAGQADTAPADKVSPRNPSEATEIASSNKPADQIVAIKPSDATVVTKPKDGKTEPADATVSVDASALIQTPAAPVVADAPAVAPIAPIAPPATPVPVATAPVPVPTSPAPATAPGQPLSIAAAAIATTASTIAAAKAPPAVDAAAAPPATAEATPSAPEFAAAVEVAAATQGISVVKPPGRTADAPIKTDAAATVTGDAGVETTPQAATPHLAATVATDKPATAIEKPTTAPVDTSALTSAPATPRERHAAATPADTLQADATNQPSINLQPQTQAAVTTPAAQHFTVTASATAPVPLDGLAVQIAATANAGQSRFEIRLDPAELGRIDVRLDVDRHGNVTSHLTVEKPETLTMLRQDAPQLHRALNEAGLKTADGALQFSLSDQSASNQNGGRQQADQNNSGPAQRLVIREDDAPPATLAGRNYSRSLASSGGVDIRI